MLHIQRIITFLIVMAIPSLAHAVVDWEDTFEYVDKAAQNVVWGDSSCSGSLTKQIPTTEQRHSGVRSLKMEYTGQYPLGTACFMNRLLLVRTSTTLYTRAWIYVTGPGGSGTFLGGTASSKFYATSTRNQVTNANVYPNFWWLVSIGGASSVRQAVTVEGGNGTNLYGPTLQQNRWVCYETYANLGTPGQPNGIVRSWIDGVQGINVTNFTFIASSTAVLDANTRFAYIRLYMQNGNGIVYVDDFAVSRDARIGCGSTPPVDTTRPTPPTGMTVQ